MEDMQWVDTKINAGVYKSRGLVQAAHFAEDAPRGGEDEEQAIARAQRCEAFVHAQYDRLEYCVLRDKETSRSWQFDCGRKETVEFVRDFGCSKPRALITRSDRCGFMLANGWFVEPLRRAVKVAGGEAYAVNDLIEHTLTAIDIYQGAKVLAKEFRNGYMARSNMPRAAYATPVKSAAAPVVLIFRDTELIDGVDYDAGEGVEVKHVKSRSPFGRQLHARMDSHVVACIPLFSRLFSVRGFVCRNNGCDAYVLPTFVISQRGTGRFIVSLFSGNGYCDIGKATTFKNAVRRVRKVWTKAIFNPEDELERTVAEIMKLKFLKLTPRIPSNEEAADAIMRQAKDVMMSKMDGYGSDRLAFGKFSGNDLIRFHFAEVQAQTGVDFKPLIHFWEKDPHDLREWLLAHRSLKSITKESVNERD